MTELRNVTRRGRQRAADLMRTQLDFFSTAATFADGIAMYNAAAHRLRIPLVESKESMVRSCVGGVAGRVWAGGLARFLLKWSSICTLAWPLHKKKTF
jgi:hypothetical protein